MKSLIMAVAVMFLCVSVADAGLFRVRSAARSKTVARKVVKTPATLGKCRMVNGRKVCGQ